MRIRIGVTFKRSPALRPKGFIVQRIGTGLVIVGIILLTITSYGCPRANKKDTGTGSSQPLIATPTSLTATSISPFQINLNWQDNSDNENGFRIERKTVSGSYTVCAIVSFNKTSYSDTGLSPATTYFYRIKAYNTYGESLYSNEATTTTQSTWISVTAGNNHTLILAADGTIYSWGANDNGQLGVGDTEARSAVTKIGTANNWRTLSAGDYHSVALKTNATLWTWGFNAYGQLGIGNTNNQTIPLQIGSDSDWKIGSAGVGHTLAIKDDGSFWTWGRNDYGQLGFGDTVNRTTPTQLGNDTDWNNGITGNGYTIGLKNNGTLWSWGDNEYGELGLGDTVNRNTPNQIGNASDWSAIEAGIAHVIAIKTDGTLWVWGRNNYGQLGLADMINRNTPFQLGTYACWKVVVANDDYSTAIRSDGTLWTWGRNDYGQLGVGDTITRTIPTQITMSTDWKLIGAGDGYTIALKTNGALWAWGRNDKGQLGLGDTNNREIPGQVNNTPNPPSSLTAVVGLESQINLSWVDNSINETGFKVERRTANSSTYFYVITLGPNATSYSDTGLSPLTTYYYRVRAINNFGDGEPSDEANATTIGGWVSVIAGYAFTLARTNNGTIWACGDNEHGQLGLGNKGAATNKLFLTRVGTDTDWSKISVGGFNSIGIKTNKTMWVWGDNKYGQLGIVTWGTDKTIPTQVNTATDWESATSGGYHTIALKTDGSIWVCGRNNYGQLGFGDTEPRTVFIRIGSDNDWSIIAAGGIAVGEQTDGGHTISIKTNGTLWGWGWNEEGQLGLNDTNNRNTPTQIGTNSDWSMITCGSYHTIVLKIDGTIWGCGENEWGQLGLGNTNSPLTLTEIGSDSDWNEISAGIRHSVGHKTNNTIWSWGYNFFGQLGLGNSGSITTRYNPTKIEIDSDWNKITCGYYHTLSIKNNNTIWGWGWNGIGQLGLGNLDDRLTPTLIGQ